MTISVCGILKRGPEPGAVCGTGFPACHLTDWKVGPTGAGGSERLSRIRVRPHGGVTGVVLALCCFLALSGCATRAPSRRLQPARRLESPSAREAVTPTGGEPYHGMIQYRAKDAKVAIVNPELVPADQAVIAPGTNVIGVFIGGEARAYPLFILNNHQVVNDKVGGVPLSASW